MKHSLSFVYIKIMSFASQIQAGNVKFNELKYGKTSANTFKWSKCKLFALCTVMKAVAGGLEEMNEFLLDYFIPQDAIESKFENELKAVENLNLLLNGLNNKPIKDPSSTPDLSLEQRKNVKVSIVACFATHMKKNEINKMLPDAQIGKSLYRSAFDHSAMSPDFNLYRTFRVTIVSFKTEFLFSKIKKC